jgi:hypothetical protein
MIADIPPSDIVKELSRNRRGGFPAPKGHCSLRGNFQGDKTRETTVVQRKAYLIDKLEHGNTYPTTNIVGGFSEHRLVQHIQSGQILFTLTWVHSASKVLRIADLLGPRKHTSVSVHFPTVPLAEDIPGSRSVLAFLRRDALRTLWPVQVFLRRTEHGMILSKGRRSNRFLPVHGEAAEHSISESLTDGVMNMHIREVRNV